MNEHSLWLETSIAQFRKQKSMADRAIEQITDEELHRRPAESFNSVATIMRHIAGNLLSRWTDFLTTDGEKPNRDRDAEFTNWTGTRSELLSYWNQSWATLTSSLESLKPSDIGKTVLIRSQPHTVPQAILRSMDHLAYHIGQIVLLSRLLHTGEWNWLTIPPGGSAAFNAKLSHAPSKQP